MQLEVPPSPPLQERLVQAGAEVHRVVPRHALLVTANSRSLRIIASLPFVRAVREYHPAYKVERELLPIVENVTPQTAVTVNLLTLRRGAAGQARVAAVVEALGGRVVDTSRETYLMTVTVPTQALADLVGSDDVAWIDRWSAPEEDINNAREFHGSNFVESTLGLTGSSLRVEVLDGGCDLTHPDLANHVVHGSMVVGNHGTACSGIVAGSGAGNASARGVLPEALLIAAYYNGLSGSRYNHTRELDDPTGSFRAILQTNSWGNSRTTAYTSVSQDLDQILFDFEKFSVLQSQSNAGNQDSRPQAWAKNVISVGGVRHYNTLNETDDAWSSGASIGPAADGPHQAGPRQLLRLDPHDRRHGFGGLLQRQLLLELWRDQWRDAHRRRPPRHAHGNVGRRRLRELCPGGGPLRRSSAQHHRQGAADQHGAPVELQRDGRRPDPRPPGLGAPGPRRRLQPPGQDLRHR